MEDHTQSLRMYMETLCLRIGARPTGSAMNREAVAYVSEALRKCGFSVRKQEFRCIDWKNSGAELFVDGKNVPVVPSDYSMPCDVGSKLICAGTLKELKKSRPEGKILAIHGELCREPLTPNNFTYINFEEHKAIMSLLTKKRPKAIITVVPGKEHVIQDGDLDIPCAVVGGNMLDTLLRNEGKKALLTISAKRIPVISDNVIAAYGSGDEKVVLSAHIDTGSKTSGALHNASGVSILLAVAESLKGGKFPFRVEIVIFNGEDYYSFPGETAFMESLTPEHLFAVSVDSVGMKGKGTSVSFYRCPKKFEKKIMRSAESTGIERTDPRPTGDHMIFASAGIPTARVTTCGFAELLDSVIHSPDDIMENIDLDVMNDTVHFLTDCIEHTRKSNARVPASCAH